MYCWSRPSAMLCASDRASCSLVVNFSNRIALIRLCFQLHLTPKWGSPELHSRLSVVQPQLQPHFPPMERKTQFNVGYLLFALFAVVLLQQWWQRAQTIEVVPYSEFEQLLAQDKISEVTVSDQRITGKLKSPEKGKSIAVANLVPPEI